MRVLDVDLLPEHTEYRCVVRTWSTINVQRRIYSVPSRLIGHTVRAYRYADHVEVFYKGVFQFSAPWLSEERAHHIDYRHVINSLIRKPGAFNRYLFRADLFPCESFRWACEKLCDALGESKGNKEYLRILQHAAVTMECEVDRALRMLRLQNQLPRFDAMLTQYPPAVPVLPDQSPMPVDLAVYDELLTLQEAL